MSRLGDQIRSIRNNKGMTRKQLARKAGISEKVLEEMEIGKKIISSNMINVFSRILGTQIVDSVMEDDYVEEVQEDRMKPIKSEKKEKALIQPVWNDAFSSVLKTVPIYDYTLSQVIDTKQLPVVDNKIEGFTKDKVFYLSVEDDDMLGFRMMKGDLILVCATHEIINPGFFFIEYQGRRIIRQIKRLSQHQLLLINNKGIVQTHTVSPQEIKILGKLIRIEIRL